MHVVISTFYGVVVLVALLAYAAIAGGPGSVLWVLLVSPLVVSGVVLALTAGGLAWCWIRWMWRNRSTFRLRPSRRLPGA